MQEQMACWKANELKKSANMLRTIGVNDGYIIEMQ
jgi:hypothetical protein